METHSPSKNYPFRNRAIFHFLTDSHIRTPSLSENCSPGHLHRFRLLKTDFLRKSRCYPGSACFGYGFPGKSAVPGINIIKILPGNFRQPVNSCHLRGLSVYHPEARKEPGNMEGNAFPDNLAGGIPETGHPCR